MLCRPPRTFVCRSHKAGLAVLISRGSDLLAQVASQRGPSQATHTQQSWPTLNREVNFQTWSRGSTTKWSLPFSPPPRPLVEILGDFTLGIDAVTPSPATVDKPGSVPADEIDAWTSTMIYEKRGHRQWRLGALEQQQRLTIPTRTPQQRCHATVLFAETQSRVLSLCCMSRPAGQSGPVTTPRAILLLVVCWDLNFLAATGAAGWSWPAHS